MRGYRDVAVSEPSQHDVGFTRAGYRRLLRSAAASGYSFCGYAEALAAEGGRLCILRHDIDADLGAAAELARIEAEEGVSATYFVMTRSPLYNAFGRANDRLLREIVSLGHAIGLHYDLAYLPEGGRNVHEWIRLEAEFLGAMAEAPVVAVSFHQPALSGLDPNAIDTSALISGYDFPGFTYVSDANKALQQGPLVGLFERAVFERIQLCIHPIWWATDDANAKPPELWDAAIAANVRRSQAQLVATERAYGAARAIVVPPPS